MAQHDNDWVQGYIFHDRFGDPMHCGISNDPTRREKEHRRSRDSDGWLETQTRWMRRHEGRQWEREQGCSPYGDCCSATYQTETSSGSGWGVVLGVGLAVGVLGIIASALSD